MPRIKMPIWRVQLSAVKNSFLFDMWKCHRAATAFIHVNITDTFLSVGPRRQEAVNSPEESDLEDRLTHTSWTLLLICIPLVIKKKKKERKWLLFPGLGSWGPAMFNF